MLGSCFVEVLTQTSGLSLFAYDHQELNITDSEKLREKLLEVKPDLVINCSAYTAVDEAESKMELAFKINAEAVGEMAKLTKEFGAVLIHFSTDYVFDGKQAIGYKEDDPTGAINVYGASKLAGEQLIAANTDKYFVIRTSWLYGKNGKNFVDTMLELGTTALQIGTELKVVDDQVGSPTYTEDLVKAVLQNFVEPFKNGKMKAFGIYHLTNSGSCSWYDFAVKIFEIKKLAVKVLPITTEYFPRPAIRPKTSILQNKKLAKMRNWVLALKAYLS